MAVIVVAIGMGWAMGANDAANSFGDWIGARVGKIQTGVVLAGVFGLIGALLEGGKVSKVIGKGIVPPSEFASMNISIIMVALAVLLGSFLWVLLATRVGMPASTTHATVGAVAGVGLAAGTIIKWSVLEKVVLSWAMSPLVSLVLAFFFYRVISFLLVKFRITEYINRAAPAMLTASSAYVAYSWGANDVGNAVAFLPAASILPVYYACALGGFAMLLGAIMWGRRVASTVGFKITDLNPIMAFCSDLAVGLTVHLCVQFGMPVSTTYALVGGIAGVGLARGAKTVNLHTVRNINLVFLTTPFAAAALSFVFFILFGFLF